MASAPTINNPNASPGETSASVERRQPQGPVEPTEQLWAAARNSRSLADFYAEALHVLATRFDAPFAAIHAQRKSDNIQKTLVASESAKGWSQQVDDLQLDARYRTTPLARVVRLESIGEVFALMATPLSVEGEGVVGSIGVVTRCLDRAGAEAKLGELKALACLIGVLAPQVGSVAPKPAATEAADQGEGLQQASGYRSASEYAYTITNGLKTKLNVAQVTLGLVRNRRVEILCISGFDRVEKQAAGVRAIQQALSECLDVRSCVVSQAKDHADGADYLLHKAWRSRCGGDAVASLPLENDGEVVAVVGLQHRADGSFDTEHLAKVQEKLAPIISGLMVLKRSDRPLVSHALEVAGETFKSFRRAGWRRKALVGALAALTAWVAVGKQAFVLTAPAHLQAAELRQVAAPFAGTITVCHVRPGTRVGGGEPIIEFDTAPIESERTQARSDLRVAQSTLRLAAAAGDLAVAATARADAVAAKSRLQVIEDKLRRARVVAPTDCVVLSGDITPRVGEAVPLGEPLLELAIGDTKRVEVFLDEATATSIAVGQGVRFATTAQPSVPLKGRISAVDASSTIHEGKNTFRAVIELEGPAPAWAIAGMEGVARIDAGRQPIWWVWGHRLVNAVRLQWWKL